MADELAAGSLPRQDSLGDLQGLLRAANQRYLDFLSAIDDPVAGNKALTKITDTVVENRRCYKGFNFFAAADQALFVALLRGEHEIQGLRNADLQRHLPEVSPGRISRLLKRLRVHGLIKAIGRTYKYYVTPLGRRALLAGLTIQGLLGPVLGPSSPLPLAP